LNSRAREELGKELGARGSSADGVSPGNTMVIDEEFLARMVGRVNGIRKTSRGRRRTSTSCNKHSSTRPGLLK